MPKPAHEHTLDWADCGKPGHEEGCFVATCAQCGNKSYDCEEAAKPLDTYQPSWAILTITPAGRVIVENSEEES